MARGNWQLAAEANKTQKTAGTEGTEGACLFVARLIIVVLAKMGVLIAL